MNASGLNLDPKNLECYINEEIDADVSITEWLNDLKLQAEEGKDIVHTRVNAYRLPQFYKNLCRLASEFVLWTAVMTNHFNSKCIRTKSCYVEGDFGELKNNILDGMHRRLRPDKFFIIHFGALKGQSLIAAAAMATVRMFMAEENVKNIFVIELQVISNQESKKKYLTHNEIDESELPTDFDHQSKL